jgi:hypothetical protein
MKRSAGVTASAVIVFIGSAFALICGGFEILAFSIVPITQVQLQVGKSFMVFVAVLTIGAGALGLCSGIGILNLRRWARMSILVFSALLLVGCLPAALLMAVMPFPAPPTSAGDPEMMARVLAGTRIFIVMFYGLLAVLGGWWLYFFSKRSTKDQFLGLPTTPGSVQFAATKLSSSGRPLSITIIGWYMLIGAFFVVAFLFVHAPVFFLGFFFSGWVASGIMLSLGTLQIVTGNGLLKLQPWSRTVALYYFQFQIFNALTMVLVPGAQARYDQAMSDMQQMMGTPPSPMHIPVWTGLLFALPISGIVLWFLVANKNAFQGRASASLE